MNVLSLQASSVSTTSTLEVRWILPSGAMPQIVAYFERHPHRVESRKDLYLVRPWLEDLSVKVRGGSLFEVKRFEESSGTLVVPGRATGRLGTWTKWSFPIGSRSEPVDESAVWVRVHKQRTLVWFSPTGRPLQVQTWDRAASRCAVELTNIAIHDQLWWTLALEAAGAASRRRSTIEAVAASMLDDAAFEPVQFGLDESMSYAAWLQVVGSTDVRRGKNIG